MYCSCTVQLQFAWIDLSLLELNHALHANFQLLPSRLNFVANLKDSKKLLVAWLRLFMSRSGSTSTISLDRHCAFKMYKINFTACFKIKRTRSIHDCRYVVPSKYLASITTLEERV